MVVLNPNSDSILETSVTWSEFEALLRSALKTEAKFGHAREKIDIGDGKGLCSRCALITCGWIGGEKDEKLPKKVILKIPTMLPFRRLNEALPKEERLYDSEEIWTQLERLFRDAHNIEIESYKFFRENGHLSIPKMYYGCRFDEESERNAQICMEFVENAEMMDFSEVYSLKQLKQIARTLGKMQASSLNREMSSLDFDKDIYGDFASLMPKEVYCSAFKPLLQYDSSPRMAKVVEDIEKILPDYYRSNLPSTIHEQLHYRPVLVNGDVRTENVLIDKDTGDLAALIDWQCAHRGVGVEDLLRIQCFGQSARERRETKEELLAQMFDSMVEDLNGVAPPYTLPELHELYDLLMPHCGLFAVAGMPMLMKNVLLRPDLPDEVSAQIREIQIDKIVGILEDVVTYDAINKTSNRKIVFKSG